MKPCGNEDSPGLQCVLAFEAGTPPSRRNRTRIRGSPSVSRRHRRVALRFPQRRPPERNIRELHAFLDNPYVKVAALSLTTADRYSRIAASLRAKGRLIPSNDIWIAAHAMETGADLVSHDRHFEQIDGLAWIHVPAE